MTQNHPTGSATPKPPEIFQLFLPMGLWFELPDTPSNRRGAMILLRGLHRRDGWPLVTYERLAQQLGYADRRNVHNLALYQHSCHKVQSSCNALLVNGFAGRIADRVIT